MSDRCLHCETPIESGEGPCCDGAELDEAKKEIERLRTKNKNLADNAYEQRQKAERLEDTVLMLRNDLQQLRGKFDADSFERKMIDDALRCTSE